MKKYKFPLDQLKTHIYIHYTAVAPRYHISRWYAKSKYTKGMVYGMVTVYSIAQPQSKFIMLTKGV